MLGTLTRLPHVPKHSYTRTQTPLASGQCPKAVGALCSSQVRVWECIQSSLLAADKHVFWINSIFAAIFVFSSLLRARLEFYQTNAQLIKHRTTKKKLAL